MALIGTSLLAQPFMMPWSPWSWTPTTEASLVGADINAHLASLNEQGLTLQMQGDRPISVILPPVAWAFDTPPVLRVSLAFPSMVSPGRDSAPVLVRMLWQESPGEAYRYAESATNLTPAPVTIDRSMPVPPVRIHRLGVQIVGRDEPLTAVRLIKLELPNPPAAQRLALAWQSFIEPEPIANHSVNFLSGPTILGRALNRMLLEFVLTLIGLAGAWAAARRRPLSRFACLAPLLIAWFVVDGWATWNLARQARTERDVFASLTPVQQQAHLWGEDIAWAAEAMRHHAPPGATYAVVAADPFYPAHRLDYLLAPTFRRVKDPSQADYVAAIRANGDRFEAALNPNSPFERVASMDSDVFLLGRRVAR